MIAQPSANPTLRMAADFLAIRDLGSWLRGVAQELGDCESILNVGSIELALHELCINIIEHAYGHSPDEQRNSGTSTLESTLEESISISCRLTTVAVESESPKKSIEFTVRDSGRPFRGDIEGSNEGLKPENALGNYSVRGYGLLILGQLATSVMYKRVGGGLGACDVCNEGFDDGLSDGFNEWTVQFASATDESSSAAKRVED